MRILQVRFKNLNSLAGEWEIDLTHPAFLSEGIFAITGPTGAGKTTLLDAICLALYGRTPRLDRVNKSSNELMSRQTVECFAEVTFETQAGCFRCHWSQRRARKRPDGELQPPQHEIADAQTGQVLGEKIRGVADEIVAATGMDFEQFTRAMLLAQGGFAAFLQAEPDERAPFLEKMTGTELYSDISIRVHERWSEERKKLEALQAELAGMQLLSSEAEQELQSSLAQRAAQDTELARQANAVKSAITWLDGITDLEKAVHLLEAQKRELQSAAAAFAPERERLNAALRALELYAESADLAALRRGQLADQQTRRECLEQLPADEQAVQGVKEAVQKAAEALEARKEEQRLAAPALSKARELDLTIREKSGPIDEARHAVERGAETLRSTRFNHEHDCTELEQQKGARTALQALLDQTKNDELLVEHLTGISERIEALTGLDRALQDKRHELGEAERQADEHMQAWQQRAADLKMLHDRCAEEQEALEQKQRERTQLLEERELSAWRTEHGTLTARGRLLADMSKAIEVRAEVLRMLSDLDHRQGVLSAARHARAEQGDTALQRQSSLEREAELLETQLMLLQRIETFDAARRQLRDGEICPLCGALEHPFAQGNVPAPDETQERLAAVKTELRQAQAALSEVRVAQAELVKDLEQLEAAQQEQASRMAAATESIRHSCAELGLDPADAALHEIVERLRAENADALARAARVMEESDRIEKECTALRDAYEKSKKAEREAERETQAALHKKSSSDEQVLRLLKEADGLRVQGEESLQALQQELAVFDVAPVATDALDAIEADLTLRRDRRRENQKKQLDLDHALSALEIRVRHGGEQVQKDEKELHQRQALLERLLGERERLCAERCDVFGEKNPDDEEQQLGAAVDAAAKHADTMTSNLGVALQARDARKGKIQDLEAAIAQRDNDLQRAEAGFSARLLEMGFGSEDSFQAARLPEDQRKALALQAKTLDDQRIALAAKEREQTTRLEEERAKQTTNRQRDDLAQEFDALIARQKELQQEIGALRQRVADNESAKAVQEARAQTINVQVRECSRWDKLHELIGSADGKKYRNFAQGLTFEIMVGYANRQLRKMSDRYLLIRHEQQPLELNVIDGYQAGEIRSAKNLSGGESFIVSLALALGLSQMASKNVRVDSLFLDEGFGTLDEEALDTALETLAGLRQDGKLIGVISHVPALKERIAVQIQVAPGNGGRSVISGPGCAGGQSEPAEAPAPKKKRAKKREAAAAEGA